VLHTPSANTRHISFCTSVIGEWTIELQQQKYENFAPAEQEATDAIIQRVRLYGC